ncbi:CDP-alcohol phosphatidyltransferase family protein [Phycicoccus sp. HDW14]|nr:CDP-alcohol phosphatidyltransferase family protein [Phycicoccus sp. HDW14]
MRALLTGVVAVLVGLDLLSASPPPRQVLVTVAAVALVLDGVDGAVARRTGTVSAFGARFDAETDAVLVLVLAVLAAADVGAWVLLIGLARYFLLGAQALVPRLRAPVRPRYWRKVVAVVQVLALLVAVAGVVPHAVAVAVLGAALSLLAASFGTEALERLGAGPPGAGRREPSVAGSVLALAVTWAALVAPAALGTSGSVVRWSWAATGIPLEAVLLVLLALALPRRAGRAVALVGGLCCGLLLVLLALDTGFPLVLDRPFDVLGDWSYLGSAVGVVADTHGSVVAGLVAAGSVLAAVGVVVAVGLAFRRLASDVARRRSAATPLVVAVTSVALVSGGVVTTSGPHRPLVSAPTATYLADRAEAVRAALADPAAFGRVLADDPRAATPTDRLLAGLRGHDVVVVFVESYGRVALDDPSMSRVVAPALVDGERDLSAAGYSVRSGWLTSPTFGAAAGWPTRPSSPAPGSTASAATSS